MSGERFLIVNGDDFNLMPSVSRGILAAHREGIVTSTTVMVNLPGLEENLPLLSGAPSLELGLHVNLTLGPPVAPAAAVPSLLDDSGCFPRDVRGLGKRARSEEVAREAAAQRERFERVFGRPPSHLDSHHHVHGSEPLDEIFLDLCRRWKLPIRTPTARLREKARSFGIPTPDHFTGDVGPAPYWSEESLASTLGSLPEGVTELMCHPGYWENETVRSSYSTQRERELRALCSPRLRALMKLHGIVLTTFRMLENPARGTGAEGKR